VISITSTVTDMTVLDVRGNFLLIFVIFTSLSVNMTC